MQPLQDLLHRIKWDPEFGAGEFAIGYIDRAAHEHAAETVVPLTSVAFDPEWPGTFSVVAGGISDDTGRIPFHRVRSVYKNGVRIWHRPDRPADAAEPG